MKYNKGFTTSTVLLIVLGVLLVGGIAYFAGKSSAPKNIINDNLDYLPTTEQTTPSPTTTNTTPTPAPLLSNKPSQQTPPSTPRCNPTITVLSPNGGEIYQSGQQITVTWNTCGATASDQVMIIMKSTQTAFGAEIATVPNTGSASITLPTTLGGGQVPVTTGRYYKIRLELGGNGMGHVAPSDESDNLFTINVNQQNTCTPNDPPSITVTQPIAGASYAVGQKVTLSWTSCNVQNIWIGLGSGGKDHGQITYPNPVPASQGSYQWTVTNPAEAYTGSSTNTYFIGFESQSPNVLVKSGNFTVHP
jgi:hypothetical protein